MRKLLSVTLLAAMALYAQKGRPQRVVTFTAGGTGDAITGTPSPALAAYTDMSGAAPPLEACFVATAANTGATTVNLNGLGAKSLFKLNGAINTALAANDIRVGQRVCFIYYATGDAFQLMTPVGNASGGGGGSLYYQSYCPGSSLSASSTGWCGPNVAFWAPLENQGQYIVQKAGTLRDLRIIVQAFSNPSMTCVMRKNAANTAINTFWAANTAAGTVVNDTTNTSTVAIGDLITLQCTTGAGGNAPAMTWHAQID